MDRRERQIIAPKSEQDIDAYEYKQKVIDLLNSNFGENYSIKWLDDTHFSLEYKKPMFDGDRGIVGYITSFIPNATLEYYDSVYGSAYILSHAQKI